MTGKDKAEFSAILYQIQRSTQLLESKAPLLAFALLHEKPSKAGMLP